MLLSICIPTYDRCAFLKTLIESIVNQDAFTSDVEIVINDGPSTDGTDAMVAGFIERYGNIRYSRNQIAVGMLPAILESIEMSKGKYTWIFGSDDHMSPGALGIMLSCIKKHSPVLALSNRFVFRNPEECINLPQEQLNILKFDGFPDFGTYFGLSEPDRDADKGNYVSFMSVFCFDTNYFRNSYNYVTANICDESCLKRHYFNFILVIFSRLFSADKICVIESPRLVMCKMDNHGWKLNRKISQDMTSLVDYLINTYSLPSSCEKKLKSFAKEWWYVCNVVGPIRSLFEKIGIYGLVSKLWRRFILKSVS